MRPCRSIGQWRRILRISAPSTSRPHSLIYAWKTVRRFLYFSEEVLFMNPVLLWALVGVISIVTIYFVWGRKLGKKEEAK